MNNNFLEDDYKSNEFEINEDSYNLNFNESDLVDIRIILTDMNYLELISKAVSNFDLSNFNVNISSIIPTQNLEIAKNTISGADLVLIATEYNEEGQRIYKKFKKALKTEFNFVEYLKLPSLDEFNEYDYDQYGEDNLFEDEIANSIIRGGLYSISSLSSINKSRRMYQEIKSDFDKNLLKFDKVNKENELLVNESKSLREQNEKLFEEVRILQKDLDIIKSDYSDLKSRFESIHSKNSLEVFSLMDLWDELFNESLSEDIYRFILISTDNFRPKNLMIGQGVICAESKEDALDWLKIIKTAFILADTNKQDLDYNNFNSNFKFEEISQNNEVYSRTSSLNDSYSTSAENFDDYPFNRSIFDNSSSESSIFNSSIADSDSHNSNLNDEESSFDSKSDDGFIYNERYEGNAFLDTDNDDFDIIDIKSRESSVDDLDDIFDSKLKKEEKDTGINVFNLKSLIADNDKENNDKDKDRDKDKDKYNDGYVEDSDYEDENEDYEYDEGEYVSDDLEEDMSNAFSNFW